MTAQSIEHFGSPIPHKARTDGGFDDAGFAVDDTFASPSNIVAVVQPVGIDELQDMPEGVRDEAEWKVWTRAEVAEDDLLTIRGKDCRVLRVLPWSNHNEIIAGRAP